MNVTVRKVSDSQLNAFSLGLFLLWSVTIVVLAVWDYWGSYSSMLEAARSAARESFNKDLIYRQWATMAGGVYVPITPDTPPNPYLAHIPERDISTPSGKKLTLINPAYMNRQVYELGKKEYGVLSHITSLKPFRIENSPDEWERRALQAFERGQKEVSSLEHLGKETYLRLMRPLSTQAGCLKCHATQGYKVGDIRGGISVSVPWGPFHKALWTQLNVIILAYGGIWSLGILGLHLSKNRLQNYLFERRQAEHALRVSETDLREAQRLGRLGSWDWDAVTDTITWSEEYYHIFGFDPTMHPPRYEEHLKVYTPESAARLDAAVKKNMQTGESYELDLKLERIEGPTRWITARSETKRDAQGKITGLRGTAQDITERKQAEDELQRTNALMNMIIENIPNMIFLKDARELRFARFNRAGEDLLGYSRGDLLGKNDYDFFPKDQADFFTEQDRKVLGGDEVVDIPEEPLQTHNKGIRILHTKKVPLFDTNGKPEYLLGISEDITDRKQVEVALRESEERFRKIFEEAHLGIVIVSPSFAFEKTNPAFCRMMGYSANELRSMTFADITHPDHLNEDMENVKKIGQGEMPFYQTEKRYMSKSGKVIWANLIVSSIRDEHGGLLYYLSMVNDITDHKRAEEEKQILEGRLNRSEKMEALGKLAGGVAHDLNNVLGVLSGYSELLVERLPEGSQLKEYAANILKSSEKGAAIIQDLLTLARRGVVISKVMDLNGIVSNLIKAPEFKILQNYHPHVIIKTDMEKDLFNINGSPVHIEKTVMNLISNAAEAIVGSGEVNIRTENRYLDKTVRGYDQVEEGDYVVLTVSDTGSGIPATDMDKIFEPFYTKKSMGRSGT